VAFSVNIQCEAALRSTAPQRHGAPLEPFLVNIIRWEKGVACTINDAALLNGHELGQQGLS